jgi:hypothetical protein
MALAALLVTTGAALASSVTWQCNMNVQIALGAFHPGTDVLYMRGDINGWSTANPMSDGDSDGIYTLTLDHTGLEGWTLGYKFNINGGVWENDPNRDYTVAGGDQILPVEFFNRVDTLPDVCDVEITFQVDMNVQIATGHFHPGAGDIVVVRGGTAPLHWWGTDWTCTDPDLDGIYAVTVPFPGQPVSNAIEHKFVIVAGGDNWESAANRVAHGDCTWPDSDGDGFKEGTLAPVFFSNVGWGNIIDHPVTVTFMIDASRISCWFANNMGPNGGLTSYGDLAFISVHGFFNGWPAWDGNINPIYRATSVGPCLWSVSYTWPTGSSKVQQYKYGANGLDNESGFQQDHFLDLGNDGGTGYLTVNDVFGSLGTMWDCFSGCAEVVEAQDQPVAFSLAQNSPNPFNPSTTINFTLPEAGMASLRVFDTMGREVATLANGMSERGEHTVVFDAGQFSTGVYFYTLQFNGQSSTRKMVLVK